MANQNRSSRVSLPALPSLPSSSKPRRLKACFCGCGGTTASTFVPGHDSVLKAWVIRVERGIVKIAEIGHEGLAKKVTEVVASRAEGINVSFMRNVDLPAKPEVEAEEDVENVG